MQCCLFVAVTWTLSDDEEESVAASIRTINSDEDDKVSITVMSVRNTLFSKSCSCDSSISSFHHETELKYCSRNGIVQYVCLRCLFAHFNRVATELDHECERQCS